MTGTELVLYIIVVFSFLLTGKKLEETFSIPLPVSLISMSAVLMPVFHFPHNNFSVLMMVLLPLLLIGDTLHLKIKDLKENWKVVFYMAFVAVIVSVGMGVYIFKQIFDHNWLYFITLLPIIMATDAISVSVVFAKFKSMPKKIKFMAEAESLFNDATAVILFSLVTIPLLGGATLTADGLIKGTLEIVVLSTIIGLSVGAFFSYLMTFFHDTIDEFIIIPLTAYIAYITAEHFHVSGILAVVISILLFKNFIDKNLKIFDEENEEEFSKNKMKLNKLIALKRITTKEKLKENESILSYISFIAIGILFVSLGSVITLEEVINNMNEILIVFGITTLIRFINFSPLVLNNEISLKDNFILTFAGIKGGLSILMVHFIPETFEYKHQIEVVVFGQIFLSTIVYSFLLLYFIPKFYTGKAETAEIEEAH